MVLRCSLGALLALGAAAALGQTNGSNAPPLMPLTLEGDPVRGRVLAQTCEGCHGIAGYRNAYPSYHVPKLGGQNADYIEVALLGYRRGTRTHETMQAQAGSLTDQDIADIAAYFASVEGQPSPGKSTADEVAIEEGKRKATACVQCHGEAGIAQASQWPNLAGQHASYLEQAIHQYQTGKRQDLVMAPMVAGLDEQTVEQIAAFFASQQQLFTLDFKADPPKTAP
ncbi:MAG TPA: c-type cytochrome [Gammaproteobacteria bacterium]